MKEKNITSKKMLRQSTEILINSNGYDVGQTKEKATRQRRREFRCILHVHVRQI